MKYRAKCTAIIDVITKWYDLETYNIVYDKYDKYIEVDFEDEAQAIEEANRARVRYNKAHDWLWNVRFVNRY